MSADPSALSDIIELAALIRRQIGPTDYSAFVTNRDAQDATAYRLLHIGESARFLSDDLKRRHPDIPWASIVAMRNLLAHEYFMTESDRIWKVLTTDLDRLTAVCRAEILLAGADGA